MNPGVAHAGQALLEVDEPTWSVSTVDSDTRLNKGQRKLRIIAGRKRPVEVPSRSKLNGASFECTRENARRLFDALGEALGVPDATRARKAEVERAFRDLGHKLDLNL